MTRVLHDADIRELLDPRDAVRWMGEAIDAHHSGALIGPPRTHAELNGGRVVFTTGRLVGSWFGYRSYDTFPTQPGSQLVVVQDEHSGEVRAVAVGNELGRRRVGAICALAADALAPRGATVAALIGSGAQAYAQLWALSVVRTLSEVRIFSRHPARLQAFVQLAQELTAAVCVAAPTVRDAVDGAEIVVLATSSSTPVIDAAWLGPGAYTATLGPKQRGRAEFDLDLPARAATVVTDSIAQMAAYDPASLLVDTPHWDRLVSLGAVRAGQAAAPEPDDLRLFCSVGLAGTEVFLLDRLAAALDSSE